jgi:signal transduction histidine kinase
MNCTKTSSRTRVLASLARPAAWITLSLLLVVAPRSLPGVEPSPVSTNRARVAPAFTNVQQLLEQTSDQLRARRPVRLRGVITYFDPHFKNLYLHDGTGGCWLQRNYRQTNFAAGQVIEVEGDTGGWMKLAPYPTAIRVVGTAPLPEPKWVTFERLASSAEDSQWVKIQGVIHTMAFRLGLLKIDLAVGADHVPLYVPGFGQKPLPTNLVGAVVEAHGVCSMKGDSEEQLIGFFFHVPSLERIIVLRAGGSNPYDGVAQPITTLRRGHGFKPDERVKLKGVVTWAGDREKIYLRDEGAPLQVRLQQPWEHDDPKGRYLDPPALESVVPGDVVEVVGYPSPGEFAYVITDAGYRRVGSGTPVRPAPLTPDNALQPKFDGELVSMDAQLLGVEPRRSPKATNQVLLLQARGTTFEALLDGGSPELRQFVKGSLVRVTGVNAVRRDRWLKGRSFALLLRSPADVVVLEAGPRWTWLDAAKVGLGALLVTAIGLAWVSALHRQVRLQTAQLSERTGELHAANETLQKEIAVREKAEAHLRQAEQELRGALDKERELNELKSNFVNVVSHEFRTPLGVILSSSEILADYLDSLKPAERAEHLRDIKACACHMTNLMEDVLVLGRVEAGKMQFRPTTLEVSHFCRRLIDEMISATSRRCPITLAESAGDAPASGDEGLLRHILQNLLNNAVKYSQPGQPVTLEVKRESDDAVFVVRDQGIGIPADDLKRVFTAFHRGRNAEQIPGSGLGLVIVKRCVELHGGSIQVNSTEGVGTDVTVRVPLYRIQRNDRQSPHPSL